MAESRLELQVPISGYVIAEDRSFGARAEAALRKLRYRALRLGVRERRMRQLVTERFSAISTFLQAKITALRAHSLVQAVLSLWGFLAAVFVLLRHLLRRNDAIRAAERRSGHRAGVMAVCLILVAFLASLLIPERIEPVPPAEAHVAEEVAPVVAARTEPVETAPALAMAPAQLSAAPAQWQPLRKPMAMYHLESPELAGLEMNYRVSMRGTSRQDSLIWLPKEGATETRRALAQVVIERHEGGMNTAPPLFSDLAARAAEQHFVIERMARPQDIRTKFGPMEAAELTIRQEGRAHACIGFRRIDMAGLTLIGWACGAQQRPVDRVSLGCFIDRLDLVGGGRDAGLRKVFAEAERARVPCASSRQPGKRLTWLDHEAPVPGLKLSARGR